MTEAPGTGSGFNEEQYIPQICICKTRNEQFTTTLLKTQKKWLIVAFTMADMTKVISFCGLHNKQTIKNLHWLS